MSEMQNIIAEINTWLGKQSPASPETVRWYALGNLRSFVTALETENTKVSLEKACWVLGHRLTDQYDWPAEETKVISAFLSRARNIEKSM